MAQEKFTAWVVDNDMAARMRLKQATSSVPTFGNVKLLNTLDETARSLESSGHVDVIFIARRFSQEEITRSVAKCKSTPGGRDSAYVIVLRTEDQDSNTVAQNVLLGADGFLLEPYSVDNLVEITRLAARVKQERSVEREQAAIRFLIQDVIKQVDRVAYIKACGFDVGRNLKKLKDMCAVFDDLLGDSKDLYYENAIKLFSEAPVPEVVAKSYKGVSDRVRKRMEAKILAELDAELESEGPPSE